MKSIALIALWLLATTASAATSIGEPCPVRFVGEVVAIDDALAPISPLSRNTIHFKTLDVRSGDVDEDVSIQALVHGVTQFQVGHRYLVEMRDIYLCLVTEQP